MGGRGRRSRWPSTAWAGVAVGVTALIGVGGCVGSSRTDADYVSKATSTADVVRSSVQTVLVAVEIIEQDGAFDPYLGRVIGQAEADAAAADGSFGPVQPPSADADRISVELNDLTGDAIDVLSNARIAMRRGDAEAVVALRGQLDDAAEALEAFTEAHG